MKEFSTPSEGSLNDSPEVVEIDLRIAEAKKLLRQLRHQKRTLKQNQIKKEIHLEQVQDSIIVLPNGKKVNLSEILKKRYS